MPARVAPGTAKQLRLAAYQLQFLSRVPAHAAINDSVELVKRARKRSAAPFVNAVLRKVSQAGRPAHPGTADELGPREIAREFAHPEWLVERWAREFGFGGALAICRHDQEVPTTAIRLDEASV